MANPDDLAALAAAFRKARYQVPALGDTGSVRVGSTASALETALPGRSFAFITAWNGNSEAEERMDNAAADGALAAELDRLQLARWRAVADDAQGGHREAGWLVQDLALADLDRLARRFDQDGTLAWTRGDGVRLRMYHPCPTKALPDLWTDWVE
ncbi:DUF3293 domain-containing protein [Cognatiluteimonas profundi]|uniref:DUF3293 domain-containing protein n=1 Tax=Cognatiluteimonas profundi TaxID=2594501 RepID=UPI00131CE275|nr:DUF3293 domain-containing protein [Lysobacter profundi]